MTTVHVDISANGGNATGGAGTAGDPYGRLAEAIADLGTVSTATVIECTGGEDNTANVNVNNGGTGLITIQGDGTYSFKREQFNGSFQVSRANVIVQDMELDGGSGHGSSPNKSHGLRVSLNSGSFIGNRLTLKTNEGTLSNCFDSNGDNADTVLNSCLALEAGQDSYYALNHDGPRYNNCGGLNPGRYNYYRQGTGTIGGNVKVYNSWGRGAVTADFNGTAFEGEFNASGDSTAVGTSPVTGLVDGDFETWPTDLTPASGGALAGAGSAYSGRPTTDITGTAYSTNDIGPYAAASGGPVTEEGSITAGVSAGVSFGVDVEVGAAITSGVTTGVSQAADSSAEAGVSAGVSVESALGADVSVEADIAADLSVVAAFGSQVTAEGQITAAVDLTDAAAIALAVDIAITAGVSVDAAPAGDASVEVLHSAGATVGATSSTNAVTESAFAAAVDADARVAADAVTDAAISADADITTDSAAARAIEAAITAGVSVGADAAAQREVDIALSTSVLLDAGLTSQAVAEGAIGASVELAVSLLGQVLVEAGIEAAAVLDVNLQDNILSANIVTPADRVLAVRAELRLIEVEKEARLVVVSAETRTLTVQ